MKILDLDFIYNYDYHLHKIIAMQQHWENNAVFHMRHARPTSALLYACGCGLEYTKSDGSHLSVRKGETVYIPQGSTYDTVFTDACKDEISTVLIEFVTLSPSGEPFVFYPDITVPYCASDRLDEDFSEMLGYFSAATLPVAMVKFVLYRILSSFSYAEKIKNLRSKEFACIADGILYMETHINQDKSLAEIAQMCHVSTSCFRKLFKKYAGVSPVEYRINIKISHAKKLLRSHSMSVGETADSLCFSDTAYFCKLFKKHTGLTPKEYAGQYNRS